MDDVSFVLLPFQIELLLYKRPASVQALALVDRNRNDFVSKEPLQLSRIIREPDREILLDSINNFINRICDYASVCCICVASLL